MKRAISIMSIIFSLALTVGCNKGIEEKSEKPTDNNIEIEKEIEKEVETVVKVMSVSHLENDKLKYSAIGDEIENIVFQNKYSELEGVLTFRGNNYRNSASYGVSNVNLEELEKSWEFKTSSSSWGGGAGWTGQPAIVKWPKELRENMNIYDDYKDKEDLVEVIYASLDGNVYFLDLETGKPTREKINVGNPIKGSLSVDPRGIPILYVGEGINEKGPVGLNMYSLIDGSKLYEILGSDKDAYRGWPAFDSSPIINKESDTLIVGGENGLLYISKLNTNYDREKNTVSVNPQVSKYRYNVNGSRGRMGIENSVAVYSNLVYFADNNGYIQCVDLNNMKPVWLVDGLDDTDATITLEVEENTPYIYCGNEVDHQGAKGIAKLRKINGISGDIVWEREFECQSLLGDKPVNGGLMATNIIGKEKLSNSVIFSLARSNGFNSGLIVSLDKESGKTLWETKIDNYMWSSPIDFYDENGEGYIIQCDSVGNIHLIDGANGQVLHKISVGANIEASPAFYNDNIVVASRNGNIYCIKVK